MGIVTSKCKDLPSITATREIRLMFSCLCSNKRQHHNFYLHLAAMISISISNIYITIRRKHKYFFFILGNEKSEKTSDGCSARSAIVFGKYLVGWLSWNLKWRYICWSIQFTLLNFDTNCDSLRDVILIQVIESLTLGF